MLPVALFDLDNTLLCDDSDHLWGEFLCATGMVDSAWYREENDRHFAAYQQGTLDIDDYLAFSLKPLRDHTLTDLLRLRQRFVDECIRPVIAPGSAALLEEHRRAGALLVIVTATNRFVTAPIAALLGVPNLLATTPVIKDGAFTGEVVQPPCFRDGKVTNLDAWSRLYGVPWTQATFYSDSHNDLALLERVATPRVVDPDPVLRRHAQARGWPILTLRNA